MKTKTLAEEAEIKALWRAETATKWEIKYNVELMARLNDEEREWIEKRRFARAKEIEKEVESKWEELVTEEEKGVVESLKQEEELKKDGLTSVSIYDVELVIAPLEGVTYSIIKSKDELALAFVFMSYDIFFSHQKSIKSTTSRVRENYNFNNDIKEAIEWIEIIASRDSDIEITSYISGVPLSEHKFKARKKINEHLPTDGWNSRYDILIDILEKLELPPRPETFHEKKDEWKKIFQAHGMAKERRVTLAKAISIYRTKVQEDLDNEDTFNTRMKNLEDWLESIPQYIKSHAVEIYRSITKTLR